MTAGVETASGAVYHQAVLAHIADHAAAAELHRAQAGERVVVDWRQQAVKGAGRVLADQRGQAGLDGGRALVHIHTAQLRGPVVALIAAGGVGSAAQTAVVAGKAAAYETIGTGTRNSGVVCGTARMLMARLTTGDL